MVLRFAAAVGLLVLLSASPSWGQSIGRWHLPSTPAQFCGYGYGPGHHVPMVRVAQYHPMWIQRLTIVPASRPPLRGTLVVGGCAGGCLESLPARDACGMPSGAVTWPTRQQGVELMQPVVAGPADQSFLPPPPRPE